MPECWIPWTRGEWSGDLLGFKTREDLEAYWRGSPGPFRRLLTQQKPKPIKRSDLKRENVR